MRMGVGTVKKKKEREKKYLKKGKRIISLASPTPIGEYVRQRHWMISWLLKGLLNENWIERRTEKCSNCPQPTHQKVSAKGGVLWHDVLLEARRDH